MSDFTLTECPKIGALFIYKSNRVDVYKRQQAHRLAFDGDFREQFNDKLHGGNGSLASLKRLV